MTCRLSTASPTFEILSADGDELIVLPSTPATLRPVRAPLVDAALVREPMLQLRFDVDRATYDLVVSGIG